MKDSDISNTVKRLRKNKGLTQEQLAEDAKLNLRTIQRIENNESTPRGDTLKRIADSLKVSENEIFDLDTKEDRNVLLMMSLSQLTFLIFPILGVLVPMAIWIIKKDKDPTLDREGKVILNFQFVWVIIIFVLFFLYVLARFVHYPDQLSLLLPVMIIYIYNSLIIVFNSYRIHVDRKTYYIPYFRILK